MEHLRFALYVVATAAACAMAEIHIEGAHGWAEALPTWRKKNRLTRLLIGDKPLTGYHTFMWLSVAALLHSAYGLGLATFSLRTEARVVSFLILFGVLEDFLWFVLNPSFGIRRFSPGNVWWHAGSWWWFMPREYWGFLPLGIAAYLVSCA